MRPIFAMLLIMAGVLGAAYLSLFDFATIVNTALKFSSPQALVALRREPTPAPVSVPPARSGTAVVPHFPPVVIIPPRFSAFADPTSQS